MADRPLRGLSPNVAAVLVLVVLGAALAAWQQPWRSGPADGPAVASTDAGAVLTPQVAALSAAGSEAEFVRAAGSGEAARAFGRAAWRAREALGADDVTLRYLSGGDTPEFDDGDTLARVAVRWPGTDGTEENDTVQLRLRPAADGTFDVVSAGLGSGQVPVWLSGAVEVERTPDLTVVRIDGGDADLDVERLAATARDRVGEVVPGTAGSLMVVSAPSPEVAGAVLGQAADAVGQIAAVSTRFDGRNGDLAGPVVVLNPGVFDTMDARAAQIVMTHEATHVLTGAVGSSAPVWVIEGFADFVALRDDTADLSLSAGQALGQVRAGGPPERLPTAQDFDGSAYGLGAVYESAWLAFRMLGEQTDDADVIGFYRAVLDGDDPDAAGEAAFGLDVAQITADWQDYLTKIASTVS